MVTRPSASALERADQSCILIGSPFYYVL